MTFNPKANWSRSEAAGKTEGIRKNQYLIIKSVKLTVKNKNHSFNLDIGCPEKKYSDSRRLEELGFTYPSDNDGLVAYHVLVNVLCYC